MKQKNGENRRNASDLQCYGRLSIKYDSSNAATVTAAWRLCAKVKVISALPAVATLLSPLLFLFVFVVAHLVAGVEMRAIAFGCNNPSDRGFSIIPLSSLGSLQL